MLRRRFKKKCKILRRTCMLYSIDPNAIFKITYVLYIRFMTPPNGINDAIFNAV